MCGAALLLVHVADGWAARNFDELKLRESEEMREDRAYLDALAAELAAAGLRRGGARWRWATRRRRSSAAAETERAST